MKIADQQLTIEEGSGFKSWAVYGLWVMS